jgi:hypothetical protein
MGREAIIIVPLDMVRGINPSCTGRTLGSNIVPWEVSYLDMVALGHGTHYCRGINPSCTGRTLAGN